MFAGELAEIKSDKVGVALASAVINTDISEINKVKLFWAACSGDISFLDDLQDIASIVNSVGKFGDTPLIAAVRCENLSVVNAILKFPETDIMAANRFGDTALIWSALKDNKLIASALLAKINNIHDVEHVNNDNMTAELEAERRGHFDLAALIRNRIIELDGVPKNIIKDGAISQISLSPKEDIYQKSKKYRETKESRLHNYCRWGSTIDVKELLNNYDDIDLTYHDGTFFALAISHKDVEMLGALLSYYADNHLQGDRETMAYKISQYRLWKLLDDVVDPWDTYPDEIQTLLNPYMTIYDDSEQSLGGFDLPLDIHQDITQENTHNESITEENLRKFNEENSEPDPLPLFSQFRFLFFGEYAKELSTEENNLKKLFSESSVNRGMCH